MHCLQKLYGNKNPNYSSFLINNNPQLYMKLVDGFDRFENDVRLLNVKTEDEIKYMVDYVDSITKYYPSKMYDILECLDKYLQPKSKEDCYLAQKILQIVANNSSELSVENNNKLLMIIKRLDDTLVCLPDSENSALNNYDMYGKLSDTVMNARDSVEHSNHISAAEIQQLREAISIVGSNTSSGADVKRSDKHIDIDKFTKIVRDLQYNSDNIELFDYVIGNMHELPDYAEAILTSNSTDKDYLDSVRRVIERFYDICIVNGNYIIIENLKDVANDIISKMKNITLYHTFEAQSAADMLVEYLEGLTEKIDIVVKKNANSENMYNDNPLIEMGLGYFYEVFPMDANLTQNEAIDVLNKLEKAAIACNALGVLQESISIINEGSMKDTKDEIKRRKLEDEYEREKRIKDAKAERKLDKMNENEDDKEYAEKVKKDRKRQLSDDKFEDKRKNAADRRSARKASRIADAEYLKSLPMTSNGFRAVREALKRAVGAAVSAGVGTMAGVNPVIGACLYLIPKYFKSKKSDPMSLGRERTKVISEIDTQLASIDTKISEANRLGDAKSQGRLESLKDKLEKTKQRIALDATSKGGAVIL